MAGGANPFLMMGGDDYSSPPSNNSNPFLMDADFSGGGGAGGEPIFDNPFLSQPAAPVTTNAAPANNATNPFAFDPMDYGPPEATPAEVHSAMPPQSNDIFGTGMMTAESVVQTTTVDFFTIDNNDTMTTTCAMSSETVHVIQKPAALDLKHTHTVARVDDNAHLYSSDEELAKAPPRRPPPPPRPTVPPSKETQDLIMSVTGAMDATSSHLLDRIPPTRTPSPVSMRDLHSPSPTPDHGFADFLDVGGKPQQSSNQEMDIFDLNDSSHMPLQDSIQPQPQMNSNEQLMNLMSNDPVCDINQNHSQQQQQQQQQPQQIVQSPPQQPNIPPARPPPARPQPPQKPPPPVRRPSPPTPSRPARPPVPPAPVQAAVPQEPPRKQSQPSDDMMDMFGHENCPPPPEKPVEKPVASTADIMSLYSSAPPVVAKPEPIMDLLCETTDVVSTAPVTNDAPSQETISPELSSQQDIHMDTSDTQSKGSVSSVTFNPFAAEETVAPAVDTSPKAQDNVFASPPQATLPANDIFAPQPTETNDIFAPQPTETNDIFAPQPTETNDIFSNQPKETNDIFAKQTTDTNIFANQENTTVYNNQQTDNNTNIFANPEIIPSNTNVFATEPTNIFAKEPEVTNINTSVKNDAFFGKQADSFDDFAAKFESAAKEDSKNGFDPFGGNNNSAWGNDGTDSGFATGFDADEPFDAFLNLQEPPAVPQHTPSMMSKRESQESDEEKDFSVFIKPKNDDDFGRADIAMPVLAPPPKSPVNAFADNSPRFNPFDQQTEYAQPAADQIGALPISTDGTFQRTDSQETPPTPLFDEDTSQPLENFPRIDWKEEGWEMQLRQPNKKKITGQRFWKKIFVKLILHEDCPILQLFNQQSDKDPFQELPLQPCYSVSEIGAQQYDNYGKIFTLKLQYIFYKERPGVRPGQVTKAERITTRLSKFAAYAIQGDYEGVKEFGSDLKKLGLPVEHAPQVSQLLKLGSLNFEDMKQFSVTIEESLFRLSAHRDRALHYKMEEVQITAVDELYVEQNAEGFVEKQIARVRLFFLGFLSGMPDVELGVNDMRRQGKEVVGRHDIIPVVTEEWIRLEAVEFHSCVQQDEYHKTHIIKFKPPDACYIELMRFRIRPPKNRELPLQLKPVMCITGNKVEIKADVLVPGFASRKLGQVPCEDVMIRIPIPECWIYLFRVEKHFRYGSVKSAHRRTGKIKGIERFLGTVDTLQESLIEVTSGQAKYEHQHRAIVWRIPRLPKEGQGAYTTHNLVCRLALTSYDQIPDQLAEYCYVEFTMPATQASHTTVRSVSLQNSQSDDPPEKYVRYLARHEYRVGIEHTEGQDPNAYAAATMVSRKPAPVEEEPAPVAAAPAADDSSSDSD